MKLSVSKLVENKGQVDGVPKNPRFIKDERYQDLKRSIAEDPEFLVLNPILVYDNGDGTYTVVGGNQRYKAIKELGWKEVDICKELGMEPEELIRLKHITGFSKLFADTEYKRSWETKTQIMLKKANPIENKVQ